MRVHVRCNMRVCVRAWGCGVFACVPWCIRWFADCSLRVLDVFVFLVSVPATQNQGALLCFYFSSSPLCCFVLPHTTHSLPLFSLFVVSHLFPLSSSLLLHKNIMIFFSSDQAKVIRAVVLLVLFHISFILLATRCVASLK